jgi:hypothetical protein
MVELTAPHALQQIQILFHRARAVGALLARLGDAATIAADLLLARAIDVRLPILHQLHGVVVQAREVVGGVVEMFTPIEPKPAHVLLDRLDVVRVLLQRIGVVEAEVTAAAKLRRHAEVETDRLGVSDVEIAVRLGRKARHHAAIVLPRRHVGRDDAANEVHRLAGGCAWLVPHRLFLRQVASATRRAYQHLPSRASSNCRAWQKPRTGPRRHSSFLLHVPRSTTRADGGEALTRHTLLEETC